MTHTLFGDLGHCVPLTWQLYMALLWGDQQCLITGVSLDIQGFPLRP